MDANDKRAAATAPAAGSSAAATSTAPVKKRGSTKTSRRARDVEDKFTKAMKRISKAADKGVEKYIERRDKSDAKRKDGALIDMPENMIRSAAKAAADATPAIGDIMKLISTKQSRKTIRQNLGRVPTIPFFQ
jgi:hypothetical protein